MLEELLHMSDLFDLYGPLLTEKQQKCLSMHLFEDFSLSEIGEELGISRQAVYDMLHRSREALENYENKLGILARREKKKEQIKIAVDAIEKLRDGKNDTAVTIIIEQLDNIYGQAREG